MRQAEKKNGAERHVQVVDQKSPTMVPIDRPQSQVARGGPSAVPGGAGAHKPISRPLWRLGAARQAV